MRSFVKTGSKFDRCLGDENIPLGSEIELETDDGIQMQYPIPSANRLCEPIKRSPALKLTFDFPVSYDQIGKIQVIFTGGVSVSEYNRRSISEYKKFSISEYKFFSGVNLMRYKRIQKIFAREARENFFIIFLVRIANSNVVV